MSQKAIVLDANILIRAVLGKRVRELIFEHAATVQFFAPDVAYADARKYLPALLAKRGVKSAAAMAVLDSLESIVRPLALDTTLVCNSKPFSASPCAMPMTGRFWLVP
jgi:PIN domain